MAFGTPIQTEFDTLLATGMASARDAAALTGAAIPNPHSGRPGETDDFASRRQAGGEPPAPFPEPPRDPDDLSSPPMLVRQQAVGSPTRTPEDLRGSPLSMEECAETIRLLSAPYDAIPWNARSFVLQGVIRAINEEVSGASSFSSRTEDLRRCARALEDARSSLVKGSALYRLVLQEVANTISSD